MLAVGGGAWVVAIAPATAPPAEVVGRAVGGGLAGLLVAFLIILLWHPFRAPYIQRDEARRALAAIPGNNDSPIVAENTLWITCGVEGNLEADKAVVEAGLFMNCSGEMDVEALQMEIQGERVPARGWVTQDIGFNVTHLVTESFEIPKSVGAGDHTVKFLAFGDDRWWSSKPYTLTVK